MKKLFLIATLFAALTVAAAPFEPTSPDGTRTLRLAERTSIYRHSFTARYEIVDAATGEATALYPTPVRDVAWSPDNRRIAFVDGNNLFITDIASGAVTQITHDGSAGSIINGATDWVYEEEYAFTRAWEFSPDGRQIAWLRFDESRVPSYTMMRYTGGLYPEVVTFKYPRAGEANSTVTLHLYDLETGTTRQIDTGPESDQYIPRIGWRPTGGLFFYRVNRLQNLFEVVLDDGRVVYSESSPRYVERPTDDTITFLPDGDRFVVRQETRTGWMHLYLYSVSRGFLNAITSGEWEVTDLGGIEGDTVRYTSTEPSPLERADYTVRLDGSGKKLVTPPAARPDDGREFFTFETPEGVRLNGWMMKPDGFDASRAEKYPLFMTQYSGPGSQSVLARPLSQGDGLIYGPLLEAGYVIACVDGRGTGGRGEAFKKCTYGALGHLETDDQIAAARHFASLPWVDPARIGIYGWSFGGFTALNCILRGADVFALAVAVAPVTSWRLYDTIYTEIYNGLPADNPAGYDDNSPVIYAGLLHGKLLLVHGTADDNVHIDNTLHMARELVRTCRQFDMMIYPDADHSMRPEGARHVRAKIVEWVKKNL